MFVMAVFYRRDRTYGWVLKMLLKDANQEASASGQMQHTFGGQFSRNILPTHPFPRSSCVSHDEIPSLCSISNMA